MRGRERADTQLEEDWRGREEEQMQEGEQSSVRERERGTGFVGGKCVVVVVAVKLNGNVQKEEGWREEDGETAWTAEGKSEQEKREAADVRELS